MENDIPLTEEVKANREPSYPVGGFILNRWSPRAMTGESLDEGTLFSLFEAARWAPSSGNGQPWRFIVARRDDDEAFTALLGLLDEGNREWCVNAAALSVVLSDTMSGYKGAFTPHHAFDTGAASENLALEGTRRGLVVHCMAGFDMDAARERLGIPEDHAVHAMVAIGVRGDASVLSEKNAGREFPKGRKPLKELLYDGRFGERFEALE